jgi:hypothetical protein
MKKQYLELERLEALISAWEGSKVMVRAPLVGNASLNFYGRLIVQLDSDDDPQFVVVRDEVPSPTLVFYIKDVMQVNNMGEKGVVIYLKRSVDQNQVVE